MEPGDDGQMESVGWDRGPSVLSGVERPLVLGAGRRGCVREHEGIRKRERSTVQFT